MKIQLDSKPSNNTLVVLPAAGDFAKLSASGIPNRFRKEVLYEGKFRHPNTNKLHTFKADDLQQMAKQSNRLVTEGVQIPFPDGHTFDARNNLGFWENFAVEPSRSPGAAPGAMGLWADVTVPLAKDAERIGTTIKSVSVMIEPSAALTAKDQTIDGPVVTHVCATNYPVIPGQADFQVAFSSKGGNSVEIVIPFSGGSTDGDRSMELLKKFILAALGLEPASTEEQILAAAQKVFKERDELATENSKLLSDINKALQGSSGAEAELAKKTPREIELERQLAIAQGNTNKARLDALVAAGKLSRAEADVFTKVLAVGEVTCIPFGKDSAEKVNVGSSLFAMLEAREPNSAVNLATLSKSTQQATGAAGLASKKSLAEYFEGRGFSVTWNSDHTDFTVNKAAKK